MRCTPDLQLRCTILMKYAAIDNMIQKLPEDFWRKKTGLLLLIFKWRYSLIHVWRETKDSNFPPDTQFTVTPIATGEKIQHTLFVNMSLSQVKIGEHQVTYRALGYWFNYKVILSVASVELSKFVTSELLIPSNEDKQEWSDGNWLETGSNWSSKRKSNCPTSWVHLDYVNV